MTRAASNRLSHLSRRVAFARNPRLAGRVSLALQPRGLMQAGAGGYYHQNPKDEARERDGGKRWGTSQDTNPQSLKSRILEAAATALASILVLGAGFAFSGYAYHKFYKWLVISKMENAFKPGDPVLELAAKGKHIANSTEEPWILRDEQLKFDNIVNGTDLGHYHLVIGEKGTGKSSMLLDAMAKINGEAVSMLEAHADLEIFRIRLGKALDYEFNEDYIGGYFSERGPRDSTALLDIERALNKLEKVALKRRRTIGRPLILIINSIHLLRDDTDGKDLLQLLQQRAEQWAANNLVTVVFSSDDYWIYERLKQLATRMEITPIEDLPKEKAIAALKKFRARYYQEEPTINILSRVYDSVGGRLAFLNQVAKSEDMLAKCDQIAETEKTWFLNQCWILGADMDQDAADQQMFASAAMVLALALIDAEAEMTAYHPELGHVLPEIPLHKAREIMTRSDLIRSYDHINLFTITSDAKVRADSVPMQRAFRMICSQPGFREHLKATLQRMDDIGSLERTREIVAKDLVSGGRYRIASGGSTGWGKQGAGVEIGLRKAGDKD